MKKIFLFFITLLFYSASFSQTGMLGKLKQKVKDGIEQRTDEGMDKSLDVAENKVKDAAPKKKVKEQPEQVTDTTSRSVNTSTTDFKVYSHYDFIPGDNIVYAEDFMQDVVGEFPLQWSTNNHGETVAIKGMVGKWMQLFKEGHYVSPYIKNLPEDYTVEFDIVMKLAPNIDNTSYPEFNIRLMNVVTGDEHAKQYFNDYFNSKADVKISIAPDFQGESKIALRSTQGGNNSEYFSNEPKYIHELDKYFGKSMHVAMWIQKTRLRVWINGEKVYDMPQAMPSKAGFNRMEIETGSSSYSDEKAGYFISNIRFAQGAPDMRSKLVTEGKLVTNGILFDVNSDRIKPESFGVLQAIAKVLKENASLKVNIIGYTDSDGDNAANLDLSKRRALAVKNALTAQFNIETSRMETDGKGEAQPVADNVTKEGKAKNRRVEFIKL